MRIRRRRHTHMAAEPYAYGKRALRARERCHVDTAGLPYAYGSPAMCVWRPCRMRMAGCPYAHGWVPVCAWVSVRIHMARGRIRMGELPPSHGKIVNWREVLPAFARKSRPLGRASRLFVPLAFLPERIAPHAAGVIRDVSA